MSLQFTTYAAIYAPAKSKDTKDPGRHLCLLERHLKSRSQRPQQNELTTDRKLFCQTLALQGLRRLESQRHFVGLPQMLVYLNASATWAQASTSGPQVPRPWSLAQLERRQAILAIQHVQWLELSIWHHLQHNFDMERATSFPPSSVHCQSCS